MRCSVEGPVSKFTNGTMTVAYCTEVRESKSRNTGWRRHGATWRRGPGDELMPSSPQCRSIVGVQDTPLPLRRVDMRGGASSMSRVVTLRRLRSVPGRIPHPSSSHILSTSAINKTRETHINSETVYCSHIPRLGEQWSDLFADHAHHGSPLPRLSTPPREIT
ncbi:hypothetical protein CC85DRAFT_77910 [Cutaneotrichosporon oleaginosum]|uniref:Uncharacterized protein n=1 Tax=Cutaneotrichosporon oleaginosum TaxID=879819 RepID=A0A0J0XNL8_9TREE|nr:uncharacterized protein CC85DRAFT_77910 [Cutaneotrichosporon oleaginosum]KLT42725.1 hypothetical protein CC85DRAFT_77910 [Cutaneotrichosporon oleaginosum]TXT09556.1 hypothetical protein COLE_03490 [Cutaneotrichosporon oleaginosum]